MKVLIPTTWPCSLTRGPPLLPCETVAVCTTSGGVRSRMTLTTPSVYTTSGTAESLPCSRAMNLGSSLVTAPGKPQALTRCVRSTPGANSSGVMAASADSSSRAKSRPPAALRWRTVACRTPPVALLMRNAWLALPTTWALLSTWRREMKKPDPMDRPCGCRASTRTVPCSSSWAMLPGRAGAFCGVTGVLWGATSDGICSGSPERPPGTTPGTASGGGGSCASFSLMTQGSSLSRARSWAR